MSKDDTIAMLRGIIQDTLWMARRYADGRSTYAPSMVNEALDKAHTVGIEIPPDQTLDDQHYAKDGMFGTWNPATQSFSKATSPKI